MYNRLKKTREYLQFNKIILLLTLSDIFTWTPFFAVSSLIGIYFANKFGANALTVVGIGSGIVAIARSAFQIPIGAAIDKMKGDHDEILILIIGNILMGIPFIFYPLILSTTPYYILQFIFGLGCALNLVTWRKLFVGNVDKEKVGLEYAIYDTILSLGTAITSVLVGVIANINEFYFSLLMLTIGFIMLGSTIWVALIYIVQKNRLKATFKRDVA